MLGLLTQPKPQRADETIITLCDRLTHSLLLEDRKAAVLSLRGLAHDSRELVASAGLRGLLETLIKDSHDAETARVTLETLLILFSPETRRRRVRRYVSPLIRAETEAEDFAANDISLWLADELLHNEQALSCVLTLAATKNDPFTAVYALQLVSAMTANRPAETKQAMLASGGISTIASALGAAQDMVRDEALILLGALTVDHLDLQKLVVFEGGFDSVLSVLSDAGGVVFGGRLSEDCLSLLANLLQYNTSNQALFTQSGYVKQWVMLLAQIQEAAEENVNLGEQAITNVVATLQIGQLLTVRDAERTTEHQNILNAEGALHSVLEIAFGSNSVPAVRVAALVTAASLVEGNTRQQNDFLAIDVPYYDMTLRKVVMIEPVVVPVAQGLLNWAMALSSIHLFDLRAASVICLTASLRGNQQAKSAFLQNQIDAYGKAQPGTEDVNLIEVLAEYSDDNRLNPFRIWFASAILMHIFVDSSESKDQLQKVTVGDASLGMEVHSFIQAMAGEMQGALTAPDSTAALGYLQLLTVWFYDNPEAVSEFTAEASAIQALLAHHDASPLVQSLAAIVLGTAYAFCTNQSSLPRKDFHQLLTKSLGRDHYLLLMRKFRSSTEFQNFDEGDIFGAPRRQNGIPAVFLETTFVDLMRDSLSRISRAIDANPDIEPSARVTFEMVEELNVKLHERAQALAKTEKELSATSEELISLKKETAELKSKLDSAEATEADASLKLTKAESQVQELGDSLLKSQKEAAEAHVSLKTLRAELETLSTQHKKATSEIDTLRTAKEKAEDGVNSLTRELFQLQKAKEGLEKQAKKLQSENAKLAPKVESLQKLENAQKEKLRALQKQSSDDASSAKQLREVNERLVQKLKETAEQLKQHETEEAELSSQLVLANSAVEDKENELRSVQNRESQARKEAKLAKEKVTSLEKSQSRMQQLEADFKRISLESESLRTSLNDAQSNSSDELVEAKKSIATLQKEKSEALETIKDKQLGFNAEMEQLRERNRELDAQAKKETDAFKNELDEKQQALDELIVLLDDLTEKKSKYKERLRTLEESVSDSEDDDDDDEDEDGNGNENNAS